MNLSDAGNDRSNEVDRRRAERESLIDRWRRAVSEAATSDYIYAYLMRVHNAEPRAMTRRLRLLAGTATRAQIAVAIRPARVLRRARDLKCNGDAGAR